LPIFGTAKLENVKLANPEQLHQVVELAVHIAAHRHRALHLLHVGLLFEDFAGLKNSCDCCELVSWFENYKNLWALVDWKKREFPIPQSLTPNLQVFPKYSNPPC
jgi:hypothetical protein